jgi:hypothetical protein
MPNIRREFAGTRYGSAGVPTRSRHGSSRARPAACGRGADVAFTMKLYVQTDLEADRRVATTLAELILGGMLSSAEAGAA